MYLTRVVQYCTAQFDVEFNRVVLMLTDLRGGRGVVNGIHLCWNAL